MFEHIWTTMNHNEFPNRIETVFIEPLKHVSPMGIAIVSEFAERGWWGLHFVSMLRARWKHVSRQRVFIWNPTRLQTSRVVGKQTKQTQHLPMWGRAHSSKSERRNVFYSSVKKYDTCGSTNMFCIVVNSLTEWRVWMHIGFLGYKQNCNQTFFAFVSEAADWLGEFHQWDWCRTHRKQQLCLHWRYIAILAQCSIRSTLPTSQVSAIKRGLSFSTLRLLCCYGTRVVCVCVCEMRYLSCGTIFFSDSSTSTKLKQWQWQSLWDHCQRRRPHCLVMHRKTSWYVPAQPYQLFSSGCFRGS